MILKARFVAKTMFQWHIFVLELRYRLLFKIRDHSCGWDPSWARKTSPKIEKMRFPGNLKCHKVEFLGAWHSRKKKSSTEANYIFELHNHSSDLIHCRFLGETLAKIGLMIASLSYAHMFQKSLSQRPHMANFQNLHNHNPI